MSQSLGGYSSAGQLGGQFCQRPVNWPGILTRPIRLASGQFRWPVRQFGGVASPGWPVPGGQSRVASSGWPVPDGQFVWQSGWPVPGGCWLGDHFLIDPVNDGSENGQSCLKFHAIKNPNWPPGNSHPDWPLGTGHPDSHPNWPADE